MTSNDPPPSEPIPPGPEVPARATGTLPEEVAAGPPRGGPVVALVDASARPEWAADTALSLASHWARDGRRVVLADLHLEDPTLHERAGLSNLEGVVDVFLYGASLARSARPVPGMGAYLISAGTYTSDPGSVLRHARWSKLVSGFGRADALLLLFVPEGAPERDAVLRWADELILLGDRRSAVEVLGEDERVVAHLAPDPEGRVALVEVSPLPAEVSPGAPPAGGVEGEVEGEVEPGAAMEAPAVAGPPAPAGEPPPPPAAPPAVRTGRRRRRQRGPGAVTWALVVLIVLVTAFVTLWIVRPDLLAPLGIGAIGWVSPAPAAPAEEGLPAGVEPVSGPLGWSVEVRSYASGVAAREEMDTEQRRFRDALFFIAPQVDRGVLYYRLLSGPASDTAEAGILRDRLREGGVIRAGGEAARPDRIEPTPLAFDLGVRESRAAALALGDSLAALGIPSYPLEVDYSDGRARWRLYGGAYADSFRAEAMRRMLGESGLDPVLVERVGQSPLRGP